jgi:hypothetical protein
LKGERKMAQPERALVIKLSGKIKHVKNLGWLLCNARKAESFELDRVTGEPSKGRMVVTMQDGTLFKCYWESYDIMIEWTSKRSWFKGLPGANVLNTRKEIN